MDKTECVGLYESLGFRLMPLHGKVPFIENWKEIRFREYKEFPENFGVILGRDDVVLDFDPRNFEVDRDPIKEFLGEKPKETLTVSTPSGGWHLYYKLSESQQWEYRSIVSKIKGLQGLDIKKYGGQVVGAGSEGYSFVTTGSIFSKIGQDWW